MIHAHNATLNKTKNTILVLHEICNRIILIEKDIWKPHMSFCLSETLLPCFTVFTGGYADEFVKLAAEMFGIVVAAHFCYFGDVV